MEAIWPLDLFVNVGIQIWALDQHGRDLGRQITLEREGRFFAKNRQYIADKSATHGILRRFYQKIADLSCVADISAIYRRFFGDFWRKIAQPTYLLHLSCRYPSTRNISAIFRLFFPIFSSLATRRKGDRLRVQGRERHVTFFRGDPTRLPFQKFILHNSLKNVLIRSHFD